MAKTILDRITMGNPIIPENGLFLENKGKVTFKLCHDGHFSFNPYYILRKSSKGEIVSADWISQTKVGKEEFLSEVNEDLSQMDSYLSEAKIVRRFPHFLLYKVKGILYKETEKEETEGEKK
jgi:hypothetical protein